MSGTTIGKLAKAAQVPVDTIRFYEKCGLLQPQRRPSGYREYSSGDLARLKFIRRTRMLGFSLDEIAQLLAVETEHDHSKLDALVTAHLRAIDQKISQLRSWRNAVIEWQGRGDIPTQDRSIVQAIAALHTDSAQLCVEGCTCADPRTC